VTPSCSVDDVGIAASLAGLGGSGTTVPMAVMMTLGAAVSIVGLLVIARSTSRPSPHRYPVHQD
jgi:hypothetical protein